MAVDCVIVGGGPAGLTAATYLARFRRSVLVIDSEHSRLLRIPLSRNIPGFPDGISGADLYGRLNVHARRYSAKTVSGAVTALRRNDTHFEIESSAGFFQARQILLATGVNVSDPDLDGLSDAVARGLIRYCPICDGLEASGARVAVLGGRAGSIEEAQFLRTYVDDLTFVPAHIAFKLSVEEAACATAVGIKVEQRAPTRIKMEDDAIFLAFAESSPLKFDIVYPCLGSEPRSQLARNLGAQTSTDGGLLTDTHQQTGVAGLYAAGDVLRGLDQVASACGQGTVAATAIHNTLLLDDGGKRS